MNTEIKQSDDAFRNILNYDRMFYRNISKSSQEFYDAYVKKCNEWDKNVSFFEPLYTYLIGEGFSKRKCIKYFEFVKKGLVDHVHGQKEKTSEECE